MRHWLRRGAMILVATFVPAGAVTATALGEAMEAARVQDWDRAEQLARGDGTVAVAVIEWHRLRAGDGTFADYQRFIADHSDWPGMEFLRLRGESRIPAAAPPAQVLDYFTAQPPQSGDGVLRFAHALEVTGNHTAAVAEAVRGWTTMSLDSQQENVLLATYGSDLADHHAARLDDLLWRGQYSEAERMRGRVTKGHRALLDARLALQRDAPGVDGFISAVPAELVDDPGLAFDRMEWRARKGRSDDVVALMLERSATPELLGRPEYWADRRISVARDLMREGRAREAYLIASQHHLAEAGADYADLEWLSGYISLRKLDAAGAALAHFRRFRAAVSSPISLGRAGYWEGRAHEALGEYDAAAVAYAFGAEFQTSFYGQLAAERAGIPMDPLMTGTEDFGDDADAAFLRSSVYRAGRLLDAAGEPGLAARFFSHLAESLTRGQIGQLTRATEDLNDPYIQLAIAKRAAEAGHMLHRAYFPIMGTPVETRGDVSREFGMSIVRRESEFNSDAVSHAGALGLMQLMPGTARMMAGKLGATYSLARLTSDPAYNAQLGTAYLQDLIDRFGPGVALVSSGYNAGPGRPARWIGEYGDPRNEDVDVVDWIESIPFNETRNYIMRVSESIGPYRARLTGELGPITLTEDLRGR
jgi:soluble lytic murein transglycosylase